MKHFYFRGIGLVGLFLTLAVIQPLAQVTQHSAPGISTIGLSSNKVSGERLEELYQQYEAIDPVGKAGDSVQASNDEKTLFSEYYNARITGEDRMQFFNLVDNGSITDEADIEKFAAEKKIEYVGLYTQFRIAEKDYPTSISEYTSRSQPSRPPLTCRTDCSNIGFESGTLSGWSAFYATNNSNTNGFSTTGQTGGACGAVTAAAGPDPTTNNDYQVEIMTGGNDPIAGAFLPRLCPTGGNYSVRIGDSTAHKAQIGILEEKFKVNATNENFQFMYAVVLENPSHNYYEQPYFNVSVKDASGNVITGCGDYNVVSGPGLPGYRAFWYAPSGDTVYVKPWTTVYMPLKAYMGQCVTIDITAADCALGGHFGYAYFDAQCSVGVIGSSPVVCGNNVTLTAPDGGASYKWLGPNCFVGSKTQQTCTVSCAGTYSVVMTSNAGAGCTDTLTMTVGSSTPPAPTIFSQTDIACHGGATGGATVHVTGGTTPYTYAWTPSGGTSATATNLTAGTYTCNVTDVNGCQGSVSVTLTQPPVLTAVMGSPTEVKCNGAATGSATVTAGGGVSPYTYSWAPSGGTAATASNLTAGSYTVTVKDNHACTATASVTITQPTALTATISSSSGVLCHGGSTGSATVSAGGGVSPYTYSWAPSGGTNATASNLSAGTYTVTVTDKNACTATTSVTIAEPPTLTATISGSTNVSCHGGTNGSATVSAGGGTTPYTYAWSPSGGTNATANNLSAGTYTITVTDKNACSATASVIITQPTTLTASITGSTGVLCHGGSTGSATAAGGGGTPPYTYSWSPSGGTNATASNLSAGTYTCTVTDKDACTATTSVTITQPANLTASITGSTGVLCHGGSTGSATAAGGGGTSPYTYSWAPSGGTNATASNLSAGTYTCTVTDNHACSATTSVTITQPATLIASINSSTNILCHGGNNGNATVTAAGGTTAYTYAWTPSGGTSATANNLTAGTYTCTVTDANACTASASVTLTQPTSLTVSTGSIVNVSCNGGNNGSATATPGGGTPGYEYSWAPSGGTSATASGLTAGTYTITVTDANACTATATAVITQPTALTASITSITEVKCNGAATGKEKVTALGGTTAYTYLWSPGGATTQQASNLTAGAYVVTVTDANGCTVTAGTTLTQPTAITIVTTFTAATCGSSNGSANAAPSGGTGAYTYTWAPSGGTNATASNLSAGSYTVTVVDANNCSQTAGVSVPNASGPVVTISNIVNELCNSASTGSAKANATGGTGAYTYSWAPSGGTSATANNLTAGTYTANVTDANGCLGTASVTITQPLAVTVTISSVNEDKCNGDNTGSATANPAGGTGAYTYAWTPSGGTNATASNLTAGTYTCTVKDANNCSGSASVTITQPTALGGSITHTNVSCHGGNDGTATITATGGTPPYTYSWNTAPVQTNATATGLTAGTYTCTGKDANGCTKTVSVTVTAPSLLTVSTGSIVNVSCNGGNNGSATATAGGGTTPYTYAWTPSGGTNATANNLTAGTYTITVKDKKGCSATATAVITQPAILTASINTTVPVSCHGGNNGSATVVAGGGTTAYTYAWAPSGGSNATANNLTVGSYTVTVSDAHACSATASVSITQPPTLTSSIGSVTNIDCNGDNNGSAMVTAGGGTPAYTYLWSDAGSQTNATATGLIAGTYTVTVTDHDNCTSSSSITITQPATLTASITATVPVSCKSGNNGSATVTANGGTINYTYSWTSGSTGVTAPNLTAGSYTVTVTDAHSCSATASVTITEPTMLTSSISGSSNVTCNGANNGTATVLAGGGTPTYTYAWSPVGQSTATATGLAPDTYTVTVTDANGCTSTSTVTITQPAVLTANISSVTNISCNAGNNGSITAIAGGGTTAYTYAWSDAGSQTNVTATGLTAGDYTVTVTDANGCSAQASTTLTQPIVLSVAIDANTNVSCKGGNNAYAVATPAGGTLAYTYSWTNGSVIDTAYNLTAGTYTVNVTDAHGCAASTSITITEPPMLTSNITSVTNVSCYNGGNGSATVVAGGGTPDYFYVWTNGGGTNATANDLIAITYTVTVTDANGCTSTTSVAITQPTALSATTAVAQSTCGTANGKASVSVSGGVPNYTYLWSPGAETSDTAIGLLAGSYSVMITDQNGCLDSAVATVDDAGAGTAGILKTIEVSCYGGNNGMGIAKITGGTSPFTYSWSSGATTDTASNLTAGIYTVIIHDTHNCVSITFDTVTQPTALLLEGDMDKATCGLSNGAIQVNISGATPPYTYLWNTGATVDSIIGLAAGSYSVVVKDSMSCADTSYFTMTNATGANPFISAATRVSCFGGNDGSATVSLTGGTAPFTYSWAPSGGSSNIASNLTAGSYTVNVTDSNSCLTTASVLITQPNQLKDTIISQTNVTCFGGNDGRAVALTSGGVLPYTYSWTNGSVVDSVYGVTAGSYYLSITDSNHCTTNDSATITQPPHITANITGNDSLCYGGSTILAAGAANNYLWSTGATTDSITVSPLATTTYTVYQQDINCKDSVEITVHVTPKLIVNMQGIDSICFGNTSIQVSATASGGKPGYNYVWNNGITSNGPGPFVVTPLAPGYYICTVTDACGASVSDSTKMAGWPSPKALFSATPDTAQSGQLIAFVDSSKGATKWYWNFGDGSIATDSFPNHAYTTSANYLVYLIVTSSRGCKDSAAEMVIITNAFKVPNVFTPNGDGKNDVFHVTAGAMQSYSIEIYNRWGEVMFTGNDPNIDWTGMTNAGLPAPDGDYYYRISAVDNAGKTYNLTGYIQLIR